MEKALVTEGVSATPRIPGESRPPDETCCATAMLRPGILAFGGTIGETALHAHHAVQVLAATTPLTVMDASGVHHRGTLVIVPADAPHRIDAGAAHGAALYLDPETVAGAAADRRAHTDGWTGGHRPPAVDLRRPALADQVGAIVAELRGDRESTRTVARHTAVTEALRMLPTLVPDRTVRGADVARRVGLSPTRLSHLFAAQVGIPLRPYILWLRLRMAIVRVRCGDELTEAAHAAGFDDGAHFTRTCRRTFGLVPAALDATRDWDLGDSAWACDASA
ncbi:helix-turn-helix transcriptional regulator [Nocardia bovistercoris]|uniref:Helix-turn-helix transcriptional regulator n=1 Tax=Nocardia bovistercoris TaxID=2785916 RepID=A0A931IG19_9NOCA|nr:helix-turn-helix transcriptional regulator [Nocardia bovistercoris]MBH0779685.1 helix-turn-helix transcriptional regulator [Nocardia bovistercoris]